MPLPSAYILCTSPRSGSTLMCALLRDSGVAGDPQSLFHRPSLQDWCRGLDLPEDTARRDIFAKALVLGRGSTDIFGLRLQRHSATFFMQQLRDMHPQAANDAAAVHAQFGPTRYIHLRRADKVAQAVSLVRAEQSGLWHRNADGTELERTRPERRAQYDAQAIAAEVATLTTYDAEWDAWFTAQNITPLRLTYDGLSDNTGETLTRALHFLDLPTFQHIAPATAKLSDAISTDWIARFRADTAG